MMSLSAIRYLSQQLALKAAATNLEPFMVWEDDLATFPPFPFPNIGDHRPKGWELVDRHFCDKTGLGSDDEPALTVRQFMGRIKVGYGYAIIEEGQFQLTVGEFRKV